MIASWCLMQPYHREMWSVFQLDAEFLLLERLKTPLRGPP